MNKLILVVFILALPQLIWSQQDAVIFCSAINDSDDGIHVNIGTVDVSIVQGATFYFGNEDDPLIDRYNEYLQAVGESNITGLQGYMHFQRNCISGPPNTFVMTYNGSSYVYVDGVLCENCPDPRNIHTGDPDCQNLISGCGLNLMDLIGSNSGPLACKQWEVACDLTSTIFRKGAVSIGTANGDAGSKLTVKNGIITDKAFVQFCSGGGWCDYVFSPTHPLLPLNKLANYLQTNKHLPNFPSEQEIEKEGFFEIKKITTLQQEKIEEAYLYLLEINKELEAVEAELLQLRRENEYLNAKINK